MQKHNQDTAQIRFTIRGNHEDPMGNALPKLKMTGRQHWTPQAQKYVKWKNHVLGECIRATKDVHPAWSLMIRNIGMKGKPFGTSLKLKAVMDLTIRWKHNAHGDPENIFGSIADSLFFQDKDLDGSFESAVSEDGHGLVEVVITLININ